QRQDQARVDELLQLAGLRRQGERQLLLEDAERQLLLRAEVEVQRALGHPGPFQDLPDGRRGVAAFVEDGSGRLQDRPPRADRALLSRHRVPPDLACITDRPRYSAMSPGMRARLSGRLPCRTGA